MPLDVAQDSEPEPDVAVVPGPPSAYTEHPASALLVVEVSDSTLRLDRKKAGAYAAGGITEFWIVNLEDVQLEVYRNPVADPAAPFGHRYDHANVMRSGESVAPLGAGRKAVAVKDLFPTTVIPRRGQ